MSCLNRGCMCLDATTVSIPNSCLLDHRGKCVNRMRRGGKGQVLWLQFVYEETFTAVP